MQWVRQIKEDRKPQKEETKKEFRLLNKETSEYLRRKYKNTIKSLVKECLKKVYLDDKVFSNFSKYKGIMKGAKQ